MDDLQNIFVDGSDSSTPVGAESASAYEGLEASLIERNDSTFPAPASGLEPAVSGLQPRSIAGLFELLGA